MTSQFGWLDQDESQRRRMLAVVELFKEEGTVDELGIGSVRDAIADILFPGTSVLHTRARYLLFIPWLLQLSTASTSVAEQGPVQMRRLEVQLIHALLAGGETDGVIGRQAKDKLKRMPSAAYWAALLRYGVRPRDVTVEGWFRAAHAAGRQQGRQPSADDAGVLADRAALLDPHLPPPPPELLRTASFRLTDQEADYLRDRISGATPGSLLAWLISGGATTRVDWVWEHPLRSEFPDDLGRVVDHGRRFSMAVHGAAVVYNLLLAERKQSDDLVNHYEDAVRLWRESVEEQGVLDGWDRGDLWRCLEARGRQISPATRLFAEAWLRRVDAVDDLGADPEARELVRRREIAIKGGRARLQNDGALDIWRGSSGLVRLDYRWGVTQRLLQDVLAVSAEAEAA